MHLLGWTAYIVAAAVALLVVGHLYRRRETPGRGRTLLAALRWAALSLLILLLFDPELPAPGLAAGAARTRVLLDASLSMSLAEGADSAATRWREASDAARRLAETRDVLLFGDAPRVVPVDSLAAVVPSAGASRLAPALQAASEAGDRRVVVLTDGGIEDAAEVSRLLPRLGLDVEVRPVAERAAPNRGVVEVEAPAWAEAGEPLEVRVGIAAVGAPGDSATVVLRQDGRVRAEARIATPPPGRIASATLRLTPELSAGASDSAAGRRAESAERAGELVRYDVALATPDAAAADDVRSAYVFVSERPTGIALVSFRGDWEPRFLQPVLEQSLGLPVRGYIRAEADRYVALGSGLEAGRTVSERDVRQAVAQAELVVLHGLGTASPEWARTAARTARRTLIFPGPDALGLELPVELEAPLPGDWYARSQPPSSPVAPLLAGVRAEELPPLTALRTARAGDAWAPLEASLGRSGATAPLVLAGEAGPRRWAVALAEGYWRWAFREGEARRAYRRLWSALAGWLVRDEPAVATDAVRPAERVVARDEPVRWLAPGIAADSLAVRIAAEDGEAVLDTVVAVQQDGIATTRALPPGHYRYEARASAGGETVAAADGPITVESYSPEFTRAAVPLAGLRGAPREAPVRRAAPGEPLHATPWPYVLLILLVSTEWVLRRRWGLR